MFIRGAERKRETSLSLSLPGKARRAGQRGKGRRREKFALGLILAGWQWNRRLEHVLAHPQPPPLTNRAKRLSLCRTQANTRMAEDWLARPVRV